MSTIGKVKAGGKPSKEEVNAAPNATSAKKDAITPKAKSALKGMLKKRKDLKETKAAKIAKSKKAIANLWKNTFEPAINNLINNGHVYEHAILPDKSGYNLAFYKNETLKEVANSWYNYAKEGQAVLVENHIRFETRPNSKVAGIYILLITMTTEV